MKNTNLSRNKLLASLFCILVIVFFLDLTNIINLPMPSFMQKKDNSSVEQSENINFSPPTEEEKQANDDFKKTVEEQAKAQKSDGNKVTPTIVTPVISSWGQESIAGNVEVAAYIPNILEEGGKCTVTMTKIDEVVSASSNSIANVSNVSCGVMTIERARLSQGVWQTAVSYESTDKRGSSNVVEIEVQ